RFAAVFVLCVAAPLVNPYGVGLYRHVVHLLGTSGVTQLIEEYQPIPFGNSDFRIFEIVLLALVALPSLSIRRTERFDLVQMLAWLHLALGSLRHAPLFAFTAAPVLAQLVDGLPHDVGELGRTMPKRTRWPLAIAASMVVALALGVSFGGFDPKTWPLGAL